MAGLAAARRTRVVAPAELVWPVVFWTRRIRATSCYCGGAGPSGALVQITGTRVVPGAAARTAAWLTWCAWPAQPSTVLAGPVAREHGMWVRGEIKGLDHVMGTDGNLSQFLTCQVLSSSRTPPIGSCVRERGRTHWPFGHGWRELSRRERRLRRAVKWNTQEPTVCACSSIKVCEFLVVCIKAQSSPPSDGQTRCTSNGFRRALESTAAPRIRSDQGALPLLARQQHQGADQARFSRSPQSLPPTSNRHGTLISCWWNG